MKGRIKDKGKTPIRIASEEPNSLQDFQGRKEPTNVLDRSQSTIAYPPYPSPSRFPQPHQRKAGSRTLSRTDSHQSVPLNGVSHQDINATRQLSSKQQSSRSLALTDEVRTVQPRTAGPFVPAQTPLRNHDVGLVDTVDVPNDLPHKKKPVNDLVDITDDRTVRSIASKGDQDHDGNPGQVAKPSETDRPEPHKNDNTSYVVSPPRLSGAATVSRPKLESNTTQTISIADKSNTDALRGEDLMEQNGSMNAL